MITKICLTCGEEIYPNSQSHGDFSERKYCSRECYNKSKFGKPAWNKGKKMPQISGKNHPMYGKTHTEEAIKKIREVRKRQKGENSPNWRGGKYKNRNRWHILKPNHPCAVHQKYIRRSRLVAEKCLGRYLTKKEIIHHINEDKSDDRPENLYLFPFQGRHTRFHFSKNKPILQSNLV